MTIIMSFYIFVSITTNFISNNVWHFIPPIAIDIADKLNLDPKVMAIALIFATGFLSYTSSLSDKLSCYGARSL